MVFQAGDCLRGDGRAEAVRTEIPHRTAQPDPNLRLHRVQLHPGQAVFLQVLKDTVDVTLRQ